MKNLPKYVAEDRLREFFSQKGEVTDAKLMRTSDGKSRQFAFIGFRTEGEAEQALNYFNKSCLDTCRITCEIARKVGDQNAPRPWSRYSLNKKDKSTRDGKKIANSKSLSLLGSKGEGGSLKQDGENDDPQLQEFLQVMQPRIKSKLWANDTLGAPQFDQNGKLVEKKSNPKKEVSERSAAVHAKLDETSERENELLDGHATKSRDLAQNISDMDYFKSKVKKKWSDSESSDDEDKDDDSLKESFEDQYVQEADVKGQHDAHEDVGGEGPYKDFDGAALGAGNPSSSSKDWKEEVLETSRLFVRNLSYSATEGELEELFSKFGKVSQVHVVVNRDTKLSKGFAYVLYAHPESAVRAVEELDKSIFQGRLMHVMPAKQKNPVDKQETNISTSHASKTLKQQREEERKTSESNGDTRAWNSLFMRPDTVIEFIARSYGASKRDLIGPEADDPAVRSALGETQVIADTKKALTNAGINVASLEEFDASKSDGLERSKHAILVKNLPYSSSECELAKMFGKFGSLDKIILPPTKILALIVFLEAAEARAAFKGLAYKRYKDVPLYLEWAPRDVLSENLISKRDETKSGTVGENDANMEGISDMDLDLDRVESRSVFVKNLNFKTSDASLKEHFSKHMKEGKIKCVRTKKYLKEEKKNVSMGYGFIEFDSVEAAINACRDLQGSVLDGHALTLQVCHAKEEEKEKEGGLQKVDKDKSSTKLLVRNIAFEATDKDVRQLFSAFGQIKSLRLPRGFEKHRGFAFVEFATKQEAKNAREALSNTHLYGRHLVIERAKEGESLEDLRAKTAAQFTDEENGYQNHSKLSKKRKHMGAILDENTMKFQRIAD